MFFQRAQEIQLPTDFLSSITLGWGHKTCLSGSEQWSMLPWTVAVRDIVQLKHVSFVAICNVIPSFSLIFTIWGHGCYRGYKSLPLQYLFMGPLTMNWPNPFSALLILSACTISWSNKFHKSTSYCVTWHLFFYIFLFLTNFFVLSVTALSEICWITILHYVIAPPLEVLSLLLPRPAPQDLFLIVISGQI